MKIRNMNTPNRHLFSFLNETIPANWERPAFTDYGRPTAYTYAQAAETMARLSLLYTQYDIQRGDRIALYGPNSSNWAVAFFSILAHGAVVVSILPDFTPEDAAKLVNHSETKLLLASSALIAKMDRDSMPDLKAVVSLNDFSELPELEQALTPADIHYRDDNFDELALINYTSGTTSSPKGVMLTYRSLSTNLTFITEHFYTTPDMKYVSILPLAHMFGMSFELIYHFAAGVPLYFMTKLAAPIVLQAYQECKPYLVFSVPMVLEKIYQKKLRDIVTKPLFRFCWNIPGIGMLIRRRIGKELRAAFGGNIQKVIIGGAALNEEVERCLMDVGFPLIVGYGLTECGPLIGYSDWKEFKPRSCGKVVDRMELRIDSSDPTTIAGEVQVRGEAVMTGYYRNEEATAATFTKDGWLRTGDLGVVDKEGNIFLRGRCKTMLLSSSGQNIYPEEIESLLNMQPGIAESLIVQRDNKLVALIYPDPEAEKKERARNRHRKGAHTRTKEQVAEAVTKDIMTAVEHAVKHVNEHLPQYSQILSYELRTEEFKKTPKRSIKRFLYS